MTAKRLKRPRDPIQLGKLVGDILTGQVQEETAPTSAAAEMGSKGGNARAAALTKKRRAQIAKKAAKARWS